MYDLTAIRERIDLRALAEEAGAVFRGDSSRCPLHKGDNPTAFHLYGQDGQRDRWQCFTRCTQPKGGDVVAFYMAWKGIGFKEALQALAERAGVGSAAPTSSKSTAHRPAETKRLPLAESSAPPDPAWQERAEAFVCQAQQQLWADSGVPAQEYLHAVRALERRTWEAFRLGFNSKDRFEDAACWGLEGKKIWLPQGILIPGEYAGRLWYLKVRRPLPGDELEALIGASRQAEKIKFGGPRGGRKALFGPIVWLGLPVLFLVEGEWDCMLGWQEANDLADWATFGGAKHHPTAVGLAALGRYMTVFAVYDDDLAGDQARAYWQEISQATRGRVQIIRPPAHDLTDFHRQGGDLRRWAAAHVQDALASLLARLDERSAPQRCAEWRLAEWRLIHKTAQALCAGVG